MGSKDDRTRLWLQLERYLRSEGSDLLHNQMLPNFLLLSPPLSHDPATRATDACSPKKADGSDSSAKGDLHKPEFVTKPKAQSKLPRFLDQRPAILKL